MWCPACRADVAAELSQDSRHFRCARCGTDLGVAKGSLGAALPTPSPPTDAERNARELLARWNAQNLLAAPAIARPAATPSPEPTPGPKPAIAVDDEPMKREPDLDDVSSPSEQQPQRRRRKRRIDRTSMNNAVPQPLPAIAEPPPVVRKTSLGATVGQMCAYFGVGLITCGTSVVLWGFFGGPADFAPTGWLVTTIGQMFLFLGVVTLISSSMEQTSAEVASRIDALGQRLIRIELLQREQPLRRRKRITPPGEQRAA